MDLAVFERRIAATFGERDRVRSLDGTFRRLVEEIGEVAKALRNRDHAGLASELSDVLAWTVSLAVLCDVDLDREAGRYSAGCPSCAASPCRCPMDTAAR